MLIVCVFVTVLVVNVRHVGKLALIISGAVTRPFISVPNAILPLMFLKVCRAKTVMTLCAHACVCVCVSVAT